MGSSVPTSDRVSAADFVRSFGIWRERASETPVVITNHGRDTHVLISAKAFSMPGSPGPDDPVHVPNPAARILDSIQECVVVVDEDLIVKLANSAACDFFKVGVSALVGSSIERAMPNIRQSFALRNLLKALSVGERSATDVPSITRDGLWLHIETFPVEGGAAILFRDITSDVETNRLADEKKAIIEAFGLDGGIGHARISLREMIESSDGPLRKMVGVGEDALSRSKFTSIVVMGDRAAFHTALERLFLEHVPVKIDLRLQTNSGHELPVRISMVELRGEYASEGAIIAVASASAP